MGPAQGEMIPNTFFHETWSKLVPHELVILTKFHEDKAKIDELLKIANFGMCALFLFFFNLTQTLSSKFA